MITDATHLTVLDQMSRELFDALIRYNQQAEGITDAKTLLELRHKQSLELTETLRQQRRRIDFHLGKPVEPECIAVEAHLVGVGYGAPVA